MKIQDFTGGLSTRLRPQYLQQNEGVVYSNIDNALGSLSAIKTKTITTIATDKFATFYNAGAQWVSSPVFKNYVEFQKTLYSTDGVQPQKFDGINTFNLGIIAPSTKPTAVSSAIVNTPIESKFIASVGGDLPTSILRYRLLNFDGTFYSGRYDVAFNAGNSRSALETERFNDADVRELGFTHDFTLTTTTFDRTVTISDVTGVTYGASGIRVFRQFNGEWRLVGTLTGPTDSLADSTFDISGNTELDEVDFAPISGTTQYVYTFYNSAEGVESAPSAVSDELETLGTNSLSALEISSDPQVDKRRIYRVGGNITTFSLVAEIDNIVTVYLDSIKDTAIIGTVLTSQNNNPAPTTLEHLIEAYAILFAADGDKLRFTPIGVPDSWPALNFLQADTIITGIAEVSNGLLVFTEARTFIVYGTSPASFSMQILSGDQGCISSSSIQLVGDSAIWASLEGLCVSNGSRVDLVTRDKLNRINLDPVDSAVHDQVYYILETSGSILAFDFRFAQIFKRLELGIESLATSKGILYGWTGGFLHTLFSSSITESLSYTSPRFIEGRITEDKTYKKVYIYAKGDIIINILINDLVVATKSLSGEDAYTIQVPQDKQRGNFIQFTISGTGEVFELEYVVGRSQNHG